MSEEEKHVHEDELKQQKIKRSSYHGGAFEGNAMRKITKCISNLGFPTNNSSYIALKRFGELVDSCFRKHIDGNVEKLVCQFEDAFIQSGKSCPTKVHVVCRHLIPSLISIFQRGWDWGQFQNRQRNQPIQDSRMYGKRVRDIVKHYSMQFVTLTS